MTRLSLSGLPAEIIDAISEYLLDESKSLIALRSTCRELSDKTHYQFAECYFSSVKLDMSPSYTQRLIDISNDGNLACHVEAIGISPEGLYVNEHQDAHAAYRYGVKEEPHQPLHSVEHPLVEMKRCLYAAKPECGPIETVNELILSEAFQKYPRP